MIWQSLRSLPWTNQSKITKAPQERPPSPVSQQKAGFMAKDRNCQKERDAAAWKRGA